MPLFMLISGYLFAYSFKHKQSRELLVTKCKQILIPLFSWSFITLLIQIIKIAIGILPQRITFVWIVQSIISGFFGGPWFLWALWWCSVVIILGKVFSKDNIIVYIILCLVSFIIPDNIVPAVYKFMYPFFLSGYIFNKYNLKEKLKNIYFNKMFIIFCFVVFVFLLSFYNYNTNFVYVFLFSSFKIVIKSINESSEVFKCSNNVRSLLDCHTIFSIKCTCLLSGCS